jgi:alpha-tubulin suppressor-like RCC1 family protein
MRVSGRLTTASAALALAAACSGPTGLLDHRWATISAGETITCGLSWTRQAYCWGSGSSGFPGVPTDSIQPPSSIPLPVPGGRAFATLTVGGNAACALDDSGAAFCWGANHTGELGDGTTAAKRTPVAVTGGHLWKMVDAGGSHSCGIDRDGRAWCWGNQFRGALGNGQLLGASTVPALVSTDLRFASISAGHGTSCGVTAAGAAYCWGVNDYGMLGDGQPPTAGPESAIPSAVVGGIIFRTLSVGAYNVCGISSADRTYCWGYGGVLGDGRMQASSTPVEVAGASLRWRQVSVGNGHTCAQSTANITFCWGNGERGRLGSSTSGIELAPIVVALLGRYAVVTAGGSHSCGLSSSGFAYCWGQGEAGQLGSGDFNDHATPVRVGDR